MWKKLDENKKVHCGGYFTVKPCILCRWNLDETLEKEQLKSLYTMFFSK